MTSLLDLMEGRPAAAPAPRAQPPSGAVGKVNTPRAAPAFTSRPVRPMWRNGRPLPGSETGYVPHQNDDLRWLTHGYAHGQPLGRWFRWDARKAMFVCLDPQDTTGINQHPDTPPTSAKGGAA